MIKVLFYLPDFRKLENYQKSIKIISREIDDEFVDIKETFLEKLKTNIYDSVFFYLSDSSEDIAFFKSAYPLIKKIPIVLIIDSLDLVNKFFESAVDGNVLDIITEDDFLHPSLTRLNFQGIKKSMSQNKKNLIKIIERGQKFWLTVFDNLPELVFIIDQHGFVVRCNIPFAKLFNKHPRDLIGIKATDIMNFKFIKNLDFNNLPDFIEEYFMDKIYYITIRKIFFEGQDNFLFFFKDITEYKKIKEHLFQKDKYTSIGTLASGIAHEINNPLTGIIGFTQMLKMMPGCQNYNETLDKILECADRCKKIVESLLIYSRQRPSSKSLELINNIIERTIDLVSYNLKKNKIRIVKELENVPVILLDSQQIQQVLINIILNAQEAINRAKREEGEIVIKTSFIESQKKIIIKIIDNGTGIPKDILPKIFDPFFTTKTFGEAMGLGLSIAYGIVKEHNGNIIVESKENFGTTFVIELPIE